MYSRTLRFQDFLRLAYGQLFVHSRIFGQAIIRRRLILYPVILEVPETILSLKGREKIQQLSRFSRQSVKASALKSKSSADQFETDAQGVPMPINGRFWSVSHKSEFVAGVISKEPVGIDIEKVKPVSDSLFNRIVDEEELKCFTDEDRQVMFFRTFTAKEAVLKKTSIGIKGLSNVKVKSVLDETNLLIEFNNQKYFIENFYFESYLASITKEKSDILWTLG
jgi:4'-phosphopantetheinyl transferase